MVELDTAMVHDIQRLAQKVAPIAYNISLKTLPDNLFRELEALARNYRFQKDMSFTPDLDLESVFRRVLIEGEKDVKIGDTPISLSDVHYFPEDDALRQWIYLAVKSRTLQSDLHHRMAEGQWFVRDALLELGKQLVAKGTLNQEKEVFDLHLDDIAKFSVHTVQINPSKNQ